MANPLSDTRREEMAFKNREDGRPKETKTTKPGEFMRKFALGILGAFGFLLTPCLAWLRHVWRSQTKPVFIRSSLDVRCYRF
jgi:hypothetical protein